LLEQLDKMLLKDLNPSDFLEYFQTNFLFLPEDKEIKSIIPNLIEGKSLIILKDENNYVNFPLNLVLYFSLIKRIGSSNEFIRQVIPCFSSK
jgi:hypothetical protein